MPGIAVVGLDAAGGVQKGGGQFFVKINGALVVVIGDAVESHGNGPHQGARMATGSTFTKINGIPLCKAGDVATCGDQTTGRPNVRCSN